MFVPLLTADEVVVDSAKTTESLSDLLVFVPLVAFTPHTPPL